jgi:hypothetical protein
VYALIEESVGQPVVSGVVLTGAVTADYTMLPAMKLYNPPWEYDRLRSPGTSSHLVHGLAIAVAYRALDPLFDDS